MAKYPRFKHARALSAAQKRLTFQVLRLIRGMTSSEIARECGLSPATPSKWRTRRVACPSMTSVLKVLAAFGGRLEIVDDVEVEEKTEAKARRGRNESRPALH
jgi:transcriptional regulator with XRE-family HTH domain